VANRVANLLVEESARERAARSQSSPALLEARLGDERRALEERGEPLRRRREKGAAPPAEDLDRLAREYDEAYTAYLAPGQWRAAGRQRGSAGRGRPLPSCGPLPSARPYYEPRPARLIGLALGDLSLGAAMVAESRDRSVKRPGDLRRCSASRASCPSCTPRFGRKWWVIISRRAAGAASAVSVAASARRRRAAGGRSRRPSPGSVTPDVSGRCSRQQRMAGRSPSSRGWCSNDVPAGAEPFRTSQ
jgi:hypothetical protein